MDDSSYGIIARDLRTSKYLQETVPVLVEQADGRWTIEAWERGAHWVEASFDTEEEACAYLYADLVKR
ncbi:hypothetical protein ACIRPK_36320 [Kitasatospora sp. NPDC101801]|uniref:hypothetical protein n=1 Tax=Kitasatospora sp. NPDC101801 TaxID=3364103 RepID=UPI003803E25B